MIYWINFTGKLPTRHGEGLVTSNGRVTEDSKNILIVVIRTLGGNTIIHI